MAEMQLLVFAIIAVGLGAIGTALIFRSAAKLGLIDVPNERSSHERPTPRGGGIAVVFVIFLLTVFAWWLGLLKSLNVILVVCAGVLVGGIGVIDDFLSLHAATRLTVHFLAAILAVSVWLPVISNLGAFVGSILTIGSILVLVWSLNLYNFMDGIDGLAGAEAVFFSAGGIALLALIAPSSEWILVFAIIGGACAGFLIFNWPPAKVFMGDSGSGFLGFLLAVIAIDVVINNEVPFASWLLLGGIFLTDATVTLFRRAISGQRITRAHRSHTYQQLARRFESHRSVTIIASLVNVFWLFPLALAASFMPELQYYLLAVGWGALIALEITFGAGKLEGGVT